jgi:succinoglycan biosynthesis transport protein ExoP
VNYAVASPDGGGGRGALGRAEVLAAAKRWWWLLLIAAVLAGGMAYLVTSGVPATYEAETQLLVGPVSGDKDTLAAAGQLTQTYAALVTSELVLAATKKETGLSLSLSRLRSKVNVNANDVTRILTIRVSDGDASVAATLANALAGELAALVKKGLGPPAGGAATGTTSPTDTSATTTTGGQTSGTQSTKAEASAALASQVHVIDRATPPSKPVGAATSLIVPGAAIAGVIGALALLVALDLFGSGVRDREELSRLADVDVLGSVDARRGYLRGHRDGSPLIVVREPEQPAALAYRLLATTIESAQGDGPLRSLLIANTERGDGAGELAANLAAVAATGDARITLVDLSDEGEIGRLFGVTGALSKRGLTTRARPIRHGKDMIDRFRLVDNRGVLLALPRDRGRQLDREEAEGLLAFLLKQSDRVIFTAPPVDRSPNTLVWAQVADATVLVAQTGRTNRNKIGPAVETLRMVQANLLGAVLRAQGPA